MERLAIDGGKAVREVNTWPGWPCIDDNTEQKLVAALRSSRWTVSWPTTGRPALERVFAEQFARYHAVPFCVAVDHGSSALVVALEALDIGPGDEVIIPAATWVATASAVLRVGALPVLADVSPRSGCLTAASVRAVLSSRTRAVLVVHLACTVADLDEMRAVTDEAGVALVEDCAQAHGALWRDRPVGSIGDLGAFSFQQGKALAAGEGGAVITSDERLYLRAQQLRADSRSYRAGPLSPGDMEIVETDEAVTGGNYCMSDLHAAVLLDQLPRLDAQHLHREKMAGQLAAALAETGDFAEIPVPAECTRRSIYEYGISFGRDTFGAVPVAKVARALSAELGMRVYAPDPPLNRSHLLRPGSKRRFSAVWTPAGRARSFGREFPGADTYCAQTLLFHHSALLGSGEDVEDIVTAFTKVVQHADRLLETDV